MSDEVKEIGEMVKKCNILLLDIEGTTTSISFVKNELFPYVEKHLQGFLEMHWDADHVQDAVAKLRELAREDKKNDVSGLVDIPGQDAEKEKQIKGVVGNVKWQMSNDRKSGPLKQLQGLIWVLGYDKAEIQGHVYEDVLPAITQWRSNEGHKVYIFSSASVRAQKLLFGQSCVGDMLELIDGFFDTTVGGKRVQESYTNIVEKIGCKAGEVLFLTDTLEEASAARAAGIHAAVVVRADSPPTPTPVVGFPVLRTFAELAVSKKRKPDSQVDAPAPKVAKTDAEVDPKTAIEKSAGTESTTVGEPAVEEKITDEVAEKMDVVDPVEVATEAKEESPKPVETVVEDITETSEPNDLPKVQAEPVVIEPKTDDKTVDTQAVKAIENMETEINEAKSETEKAKVEEKSVITEIEDVTDKQVPAEIIKNIVPIVEEPPAEMEELQNVGEVLEKECDEILSKVLDVTNLDSIPVKPILNSIAEETMENTDSNDIVDKILDTEIEMGLKQSTEGESKATETTKIPDEPPTKTNGSTSDEKKDPEVTAITDNKSIESDKTNGIEPAPKTAEVEITDKPDIVTEKPADKAETVETETTQIETIQQEPKTTPEKQNDKLVEEVKNISTDVPEAEEPHVNGKSSNGEAITLNGNAKDVELNDRLTVENGTKVNGSNGDAIEKNGATDKPTEVVEIKTKPVPAVEETRAEPIEQVTEA